MSEGSQSVSWVLIKPSPGEFVDSFVAGSDYWGNMIRKEFKNINNDHIDFINNYKNILNGLISYIKEFHKTGLTWNPKGIDIKDYNESNTTSTTSTNNNVEIKKEEIKKDTNVNNNTVKPPSVPTGNLFAELSKGGAITAGLKQVTKGKF